MKWSVNGETGEFSQRTGSRSHLSFLKSKGIENFKSPKEANL